MAVSVCHDAWNQVACLFCTSSDHAFGPIFTGPTAGDDAEAFIQWVRNNGPFSGFPREGWMGDGRDVRDYTPNGQEGLVLAWRHTHTENEGDGREPDGQRVEGHRIVPTDR